MPILIEENGNCIYDSHYILEWLERRYPEPPLVPSGVDAALEAKLRQLLGERLIEFMATLIFEISRPAPSAPWVERQEKKLRGALQELDRLVANRVISDTRPIDVGDIAIGTALLGMEAGVAMGHCPNDERFNWRAGYPALARYMAVLEARPSFVATPFREMEIDKTAVVG